MRYPAQIKSNFHYDSVHLKLGERELKNESTDEEELDLDDFEELFPVGEDEDLIEVTHNRVGVERLVWDESKQRYSYPEEMEKPFVIDADEDEQIEDEEIVVKDDEDEVFYDEVWLRNQERESLCPNCFVIISKYVVCGCGWAPQDV